MASLSCICSAFLLCVFSNVFFWLSLSTTLAKYPCCFNGRVGYFSCIGTWLGILAPSNPSNPSFSSFWLSRHPSPTLERICPQNTQTNNLSPIPMTPQPTTFNIIMSWPVVPGCQKLFPQHSMRTFKPPQNCDIGSILLPVLTVAKQRSTTHIT